ncbi:hypothetical protein RJ641_000134 [Dillenia turbinata]|uniref:Exonuclease domain-containing protein n=1 Tax=Dillenia turbinata TaxID=194707 RepID=A0AAN8WEU6_9MAGN
MGNQPKSPKEQEPLNPNWAHLQQKLKSHGNKPSRPSHNSSVDTPNGLLGIKLTPITDISVSYPSPYAFDSVIDTISLDCEMVGVSLEGNKSALGRVTLVNKMKLFFYVIILLLAKNFWTVQKKVAELIKGKILVGHALPNDLKCLSVCNDFYFGTGITFESSKEGCAGYTDYPPFLRNGRRKALRKLAAEFLGIEIQNGEHCPIEDARAAMLLYQRNRKEWEKSIKQRRKLQGKQQKNKNKLLLKDGNQSDANHATDNS